MHPRSQASHSGHGSPCRGYGSVFSILRKQGTDAACAREIKSITQLQNSARCDCELESTAAMEEASARAQVRLARIASHMRAPEVRRNFQEQFGGFFCFNSEAFSFRFEGGECLEYSDVSWVSNLVSRFLWVFLEWILVRVRFVRVMVVDSATVGLGFFWFLWVVV
jgi:hypothetical protein